MALTMLIADSSLPVGYADVDLLLRYRDAVVDSFRQRLFDFGALASVDLAVELTGSRMPYDDDLIPTKLAEVASTLPRRQDVDGPAPTDTFERQSTNISVDRWRQAAIESLAASNALSADLPAWTQQKSGAHWLVMADLAVGLEALTLLDDRLREVGLLNEHDVLRQAEDVEESRAVLAHAARVSAWRSSTDAANHLAPSTRTDPASDLMDHGPVRLVRDASDLVSAQTRLAQALKPLTSRNSASLGEPHISARTARTVAVGQLFIAHISQQMVGADAHGAGVREQFRERATRLADIDRQLAYLVDENPDRHMAGTLIHWQQSEITTSLQRLLRDQRIPRMTPARLDALEDASRAACHQFGSALRMELVRGDSNLRIADPSQQVGATRVHRRSELGTSLTDLVNESAPRRSITPSIHVQRAVLRHTVDTTPTTTTRAPTTTPARVHSR